ncbi:MAG: ABC transporter permease [Gemmatimonadetes bacterium]|nr:ABC transporter permease [Gemmatimonadota bacterium]
MSRTDGDPRRRGGEIPSWDESEARDEIRFHLEMRAQELIDEGMSPEEARTAAREAIGDVDEIMSECESAREPDTGREGGVGFMERVVSDVRHAVRSLGKSPGFTLVTILTLAIGIGANSAIFSVVSGVLLQPLPYDEPENLVYINTYFLPESGYDFPEYAVGSPEYFDYQNQNRSMEEIAAVSTEPITITAGLGDPEVIRAGWVSPSMFTVLRTPPLIGRTLIAADGGAEPAHVVVLSYDFWQRRFGGEEGVLGQVIDMGMEVSEDPVPAEVVGVMPEGFGFPDPGIQLWGPLPLDPARTWRGGHWFTMIGRLAQGVSFERADAEMKEMMVEWAEVYPDHHVGHGLFMRPLLNHMVKDVRSALLLLLGAVGFVMLIACANVANLLLARGEERRRDMAVRSALGAGRGRLFQQFLTESLLLAIVGGALGLVLAWVGVDALLALEAGTIPRVQEVGLDGRVLTFTTGVVLLATLVFGLWPALREAAPNLASAFKDSGRWTTAGRGQMRLRKLIVVSEIALSILLVVGAGLMVRSFQNLLGEDPGFRDENLIFARFSLPAAEYEPEAVVIFFDRLVEETRALPGVLGASLISRPPLLWEDQRGRFHIEGREPAAGGPMCCVGTRVGVGEDLFQLLGIELVRGRLLEATDHRPEGPAFAVIDEEAARQYWPDEDPIGKRVSWNPAESEYETIVGVVRNVTFDGPGKIFPTLYNPKQREPHFAVRSGYLVVRTSGNAGDALGPIRGIVRELDPSQAVASAYTMEEIKASAVARPRFILSLLGVFAAVALLLGAIGIYGVMSHGVAQRVDEIGIRRALGAEGKEVVHMVVRQGMELTGLGIAIGLVAAFFATRLLAAFLHEVSATDPWTFGAVAVGVVGVALLASWVPARRASRIDPMEALRVE